MNAVIGKEANHCQSSKQDNSRVATDKAGLEMANEGATLSYNFTKGMQKTIDNTDVK